MPGPNAETELCDACRQQIAAARYALHTRGVDGGHPECPKQDIVEIALRARGEWDALRARYQQVPARW
jgi:hypothetical protein